MKQKDSATPNCTIILRIGGSATPSLLKPKDTSVPVIVEIYEPSENKTPELISLSSSVEEVTDLIRTLRQHTESGLQSMVLDGVK